MQPDVIVVGAGLAGSECVFQLAERGLKVRLIEQKPEKKTPAQELSTFAELVCSNSFRAAALENAVGLMKEEMRRLGSLVMKVGAETQVPAGGAFAVDREKFSQRITEILTSHPNITVVHQEMTELPKSDVPVVIATGPLTGTALAHELEQVIGTKKLAYYDAIAPIIDAESINMEKAFFASRWDKGGDDAYVNCPLNKDEYEAFVDAVLGAEKVEAKSFEDVRYFEGCLPVEVMAERGRQTLAFGPMKPVGLTDPKTGRWPHAVVQLRTEDIEKTAYNIVGFQSRMKWPEQKRVFRMIPGLENAEFVRYGSIHRNTFVNAPVVLNDQLALVNRPNVYLAGQISGVEGYAESAAMGLVLGLEIAHRIKHHEELRLPETTALGSLRRYLRTTREDFQPSNIVWNMFLPLSETDTAPYFSGFKKIPKKMPKHDRARLLAERALKDLLETCGKTDIK